MRLAKITIVLIIIAALIGWIRDEHTLGHIAKCLPFCSGAKPSFFDFGAVAMVILAIWGLARLKRHGDDGNSGPEDAWPEPHEVAGADDADNPQNEANDGEDSQPEGDDSP
ncbi:MAG: hypothetical protein WC869_02235 [Phycisphaerae bacterium]|jgi:hypothetical protein